MISRVWGGADYPITQPYDPAVHCGIDIGCPSGTTIYAARAGTVERVQTGMVSVHVSGSTQRDFYLHGFSLVPVGAPIAAGDAVISSDTVQVDPRYPLTGAHLHFEVQDGLTLPGAPPYAPGRPLDPVPILNATYGGVGSTLDGMASADDILAKLDSGFADLWQNQTWPNLKAVLAKLDALGARVAALEAGLPGASGGLTAAQAGTLDTMAGDIATVKRLIEKDLAP